MGWNRPPDPVADHSGQQPQRCHQYKHLERRDELSAVHFSGRNRLDAGIFRIAIGNQHHMGPRVWLPQRGAGCACTAPLHYPRQGIRRRDAGDFARRDNDAVCPAHWPVAQPARHRGASVYDVRRWRSIDGAWRRDRQPHVVVRGLWHDLKLRGHADVLSQRCNLSDQQCTRLDQAADHCQSAELWCGRAAAHHRWGRLISVLV